MASKVKILIVEDNSDLRRLYAIGLNQHGYEVKLAANGAEAVDRVANEKPDLILLDLIMPIMDGWEVIAKVNSEEREPPIPVIVITGQRSTEKPDHAPAIAAWLEKPVSIELLVETIATELATRQIA